MSAAEFFMLEHASPNDAQSPTAYLSHRTGSSVASSSRAANNRKILREGSWPKHMVEAGRTLLGNRVYHPMRSIRQEPAQRPCR